jgi:hypothetical protein
MTPSETTNPDGNGQEVHLDVDLLKDLLHDLLPSATKRQAYAHMVSCPACETRFREKYAARERLRSRGAPRLDSSGEVLFDSFREEAVKDPSAAAAREPAISLRRMHLGLLALARRPAVQLAGGLSAAAIILAVVLLNVQTTGGPPPQIRALPSFTADLTPRGPEDLPEQDDLLAGLAAYDSENLERAIALLVQARAEGPFEVVRKAYLGSALARTGRHAEAVDILMSIEPMALPEDYFEARWTLYVSLLECGLHVRADSLLRVLAGEYGELGRRAQQTLGR